MLRNSRSSFSSLRSVNSGTRDVLEYEEEEEEDDDDCNAEFAAE